MSLIKLFKHTHNRVILIVLICLVLIAMLTNSIAMFFFDVSALNLIQNIPLCVFKWMTSFDCPGCGMTRAFLYLSQFQFIEAFKSNIFSIPLFLAMILTLYFKNVPTILCNKIFSVGSLIVVLLHWLVKSII